MPDGVHPVVAAFTLAERTPRANGYPKCKDVCAYDVCADATHNLLTDTQSSTHIVAANVLRTNSTSVCVAR